MKYAQTIASKSPLTLKIGKEAFYRQAEMGLAEAYDYASRVMVENMLAQRRRGRHRRLHRASASRNGGENRMEPRISIVTIAVDDLDRAVRFYEAMGLKRHPGITDGVAFFQMGGAILGLFPRKERRGGFRR